MKCHFSCLLLSLLLLTNSNSVSSSSHCPVISDDDVCTDTIIEISDPGIDLTNPFTVSVTSMQGSSLASVVIFDGNNCTIIDGVTCTIASQNDINNNNDNNNSRTFTGGYTVNCILTQTFDERTTAISLLFEIRLKVNRRCFIFQNTSILTNTNNTTSNPTYCSPDLKQGLLWPLTEASTKASISCENISKKFVSTSVVTRNCLKSGSWKTSVDMSDCRLKPDYDGTMYIWLEIKDIEDLSYFETLALYSWVKDLMSHYLIQYTNVYLYTLPPYRNVLPVQITVDLNQNPTNTNTDFDQTANTNTDLNQTVNANTVLGFTLMQLQVLNMTQFSNTSIVDKGLYVFWKNDSCPCQKDTSSFIVTTCVGVRLSPCVCVNNKCSCNSPYYVGDNNTCTLDSDKDSYPDIPLDSCTYTNSNQTYCIKDNCRLIYNPLQSDNDCIGCWAEVDSIWGLWWNFTEPGNTAIQYCPQSTTNIATRYCNSESIWVRPHLKHCSGDSWFFNTLFNEADTILHSNQSLSSQFSELLYLYGELTDSYGEMSSLHVRRSSHALMNINKMIETTLYFLQEHEKESEMEEFELDSLMMVSVFDDLLEKDNVNGWRELEESDDTFGSTLLLENIEKYALLYAYTTRTSSDLKGNNIYIKSELYDGGQRYGSDYMLNSSLNDSTVSICIPEAILKDTLITNSSNQTIPIISIHFMNMEQFLYNNISSYHGIASTVWAERIGEKRNFDYPINITFSVSQIDSNVSQYVCSYWNTITHNWSTDGVSTTVRTISSNDKYGEIYVTCSSYHLTAFAVLISDTNTIPNFPRKVHVALNAICYIGCVASSLCLFLSIIFFASQYKDLLEKTHMFIHLNLVIALFFAYTVFSLGVELAASNIIACTIVAAVMHYFFLASFCWMLCEGVMLYLLLVVVFTKHSRKWYLFMILGWVTPLLPVSLGLIIRYDEYIMRDEHRDIQWCWLANDNGLVWALAGPMILFITINICFYCLIVWNLWKSKRMEKRNTTRPISKTSQVISLLKGCVILLPLLGFTWLGGLLTLNDNTAIMASIFSVVNSLQGVAIFFLYVVRNDKVWSHLTICCRKRKRSKGKKNYSPTTSSARLTSNRSGSLISNSSSCSNGNKASSTELLTAINEDLTLSRLSLFKPDIINDEV